MLVKGFQRLYDWYMFEWNAVDLYEFHVRIRVIFILLLIFIIPFILLLLLLSIMKKRLIPFIIQKILTSFDRLWMFRLYLLTNFNQFYQSFFIKVIHYDFVLVAYHTCQPNLCRVHHNSWYLFRKTVAWMFPELIQPVPFPLKWLKTSYVWVP